MDRLVLSSDTKGKMVPIGTLNTNDRISKLSNDLLLKILSRLFTEEAIRTSALSKRWVDVWKETSDLYLDMRRIAKATNLLPDVARSVTKIIEDHRGHLERCSIYHYSHQFEDRMFESWIQSLVNVKHVKHLTLVNLCGRRKPNTKSSVTLDLPPKSFSHPNLKSLLLGHYNLEAAHAFTNSGNLKNLKLFGISADIGVINVVLVSCIFLEMLMLQMSCHKRSGFLKIENRNLKFLYLSCSGIDGIEVSSPSLDILSVGSLSCQIENFVIANPRLQFNRNYWVAGKMFPHTSYYISCPHQGEESSGHEHMMSYFQYMKSFASSMSVSVDLTNTKEVEMLKEVLVAWPGVMGEIEILFKNNNVPRKESESSNGRTRKKFWEETKPFPNAQFHAYNVWLCNFSGSKEECALASHLITQGSVMRSMTIKPSSFSPSKKLEIDAAVATLKELPKGHKELRILVDSH